MLEVHRWCRSVLSWWHPAGGNPTRSTQGYDVLVTPTLATPPPPIGYLSEPGKGGRIFELLQYTAQFNVTGQPAISLPLHMTADGLPVGVQLVAAYGREDLLVRLAAQLEAAAPWIGIAFGVALYFGNLYGFSHIFPWLTQLRTLDTLAAHVLFGIVAATTYRHFATPSRP